jgi:hypothetical protein
MGGTHRRSAVARVSPCGRADQEAADAAGRTAWANSGSLLAAAWVAWSRVVSGRRLIADPLGRTV